MNNTNKKKGVSLELPRHYFDFIKHVRATTPGGFNFNGFVREALDELAKKHNVTLK
jgi:hypothetical protein